MKSWVPKRRMFIFTLLACMVVRGGFADDVCDCPIIFVSARGPIEEAQSALLGSYTKTQSNGMPFYVHDRQAEKGNSYYMAYRKPDLGGFGGWTIGPEINGNILNIATRNTAAKDCPIGIGGAYDRNRDYDATFKVECFKKLSLSESEVKEKCCPRVWVNGSEEIEKIQNMRLGLYTQTDRVFNSHPTYKISRYGHISYLFFQKWGTSIDGWMIDSNIGTRSYAMTTGVETECPEDIVSVKPTLGAPSGILTLTCSGLEEAEVYFTPPTATDFIQGDTFSDPSQVQGKDLAPAIHNNVQPTPCPPINFERLLRKFVCPNGVDKRLCDFMINSLIDQLERD